jgi:ATP-binding cassette, subfamily C (CFTR/MRP), member 1
MANIFYLVATALSMKAASYVTSRQNIWLQAIQARINFTSEIMGSMTNVKMLGLTEKMTDMIQAMRVTELDLSKRFRRLSSLNVCIGEFIKILEFGLLTAASESPHDILTGFNIRRFRNCGQDSRK